MTITQHFDNPDDAQEFVVSATTTAAASFPHHMTVTATYPGGRYTRAIVFGDVEHITGDQPYPALTALFAGFNAIHGGMK